MKEFRFRTGGAVTLAYLVIFPLILWHCGFSAPDKWNEWGDFFAGYFSPIAFFWLVIGYYQQGKELSAGSDAINRQIAELAASVKSQIELVEATREQVQIAESALKLEKAKIQPQFRIELGREGVMEDYVPPPTMGGEPPLAPRYWEVDIKSLGPRATDVLISFQCGGRSVDRSRPIFDAGESVTLRMPDQWVANEATVAIRYTDILSNVEYRYWIADQSTAYREFRPFNPAP